jgi:hypothetical protein
MKREMGKFWIVGNRDPSYGTMEIWVDGKHIADVDTSSSKHELEQVLYVSPPYDMSYKHLELRYSGKPIAVHAIYYRHKCGPITKWPTCEPQGMPGLYELETNSYSVKRGEDLKVKVHRYAGSDTRSQVYLTTVPDTAVPGVDYEHLSTDLEFKVGEIEKEVTIKIRSSGSGSRFSVEIMGATNYTIVSEPWTASINIVGNSLDASRVEVSRFGLGGVVLCLVAGIVIVVLMLVKKRKNHEDLLKEEGLVSYTENQALDQNN